MGVEVAQEGFVYRDIVTVVITTHNRHELLTKALHHYDGLGISLIVVDSTPVAYDGLGAFNNVEYVHCPGEPLPHKLRAPVLERVKTPYMFFSADDMFISPLTIAHCIEFLQQNQDYVSAQGLYFGLPMNGDKSRLRAMYVNAENYDNTIDAETPEQRMLQLFCRYVPTFYAVFRTECWQLQMSLYPENIRNYCLFEFFFALCAVILGKHKILAETYALTYLAPTVNGLDKNYRNDLHELATLERYQNEYRAFDDAVTSLLLAKSSREELQARLFVHKAVAMQAWKRKPILTTGEKISREWAKALTKLFDGKGLKLRRAQRREDERRVLEEEYTMLLHFVGEQGALVLDTLLQGIRQ